MSDWEDAPSSQTQWEDAPAPKGADSSTLSKITKTGLGGLEAGVNAASSMAAFPLTVGFGALESINRLTQGKTPITGKELEDIQRTFTYEPRTEEGKSMAEDLATSGFMQSLNALGGVVHTLPPIRLAPKIPKVPESIKEPTTIKEKIDAVRAERNANMGWEDAPNQKVNEAIPPEVRAAQETLNAQDAGGNKTFLKAPEPVDLSAQRELPFTNENLPNRQELQGDLFGDKRPLEVPERPTIAPDFSRAQSDANRMGDLFTEQEVGAKALETKRAEIEQMYQERARSAMADKDRQAFETAKAQRDTALQSLEQRLRDDAYTPIQGRKLTIPRSERGSAPFINDLADLIIKHTANGLEAYRGAKKVGYLKSNLTPEQSKALGETANVDMVKAERGQGIGAALYKAWNEAHEGRIAPSGKTTQEAWNVWKREFPKKVDSFVEQEAARLRSGAPREVVLENITDPTIRKAVLEAATIRGPKGQRGAAPVINDIAGALQERAKAINDILKENFFTPNTSVADVVAKAIAEKDSGSINNLEAGGTLASMKRKSTVVTEGVRYIQTALKQAELNQRNAVHPARSSLKKLSKQEIADLGEVFKLEMFEGHKLSPEQTLGLGLSEKQMKAYVDLRDMFNKALDAQNASRIAKGEEPITPKEAYLSSRWKGDFRRPVYAIRFAEDGVTPIINKSTGEIAKQLVWYLAADSKRGLESQYKALKKQFPEYEAGKDSIVKSLRGGNSPKEMLSTAIDLLGRDDPAVARIREWAEEQTVAEGSKVLGQEKHFETKHNIRGFVGDRPGRNPKQEAIDMFQEQLQYADNAFKWAELQKAADQLKELTNNPELLEKQPNNIAYLQDYARNHMGMGEAQWIKAAEDAIRSTGVSPHVIAGVVGGMKTLFILQKMAVSTGFGLANVIQFVNNIPHLVDISKNPLEIAMATTVGIPAGMAMATGHYLNARGTSVYQMVGAMPNGKFLVKAMKYFEDNGGTSRSILDESPVGHSFSVLGKAENIAGQTLAIPETYLRSSSFMTYVQLLKSTGKFTNDLELFRHAEERVNAAMGDYRQGEKALMFSKLGTMGNALNTLQTYPMNWYQQLNYFGREVGKGNVLPLMTMLATQYVVAGAMGIPGFNDMSKLWEKLKEYLPDSAWDKVKDISLPGLILQVGGESSLYGPLSTKTGIAMTSRVTAPGAGEMLTSPAGPAIDIAKQVGSLASLAGSPTDKDAQAQAIMNSIPTGLQGLMETGPLRTQTSVPGPNNTRIYGKATDVAAHKGMVSRTPEEELLRKFGLRSQNEVFSKDQAYMASKQETDARKRAGDLTDKIYASARQGNQARTQELISLYERLLGKDSFDKSMQKQVMDEYTTAVQRTSIGAKTVPGLIAVKKMQEFFKERENAN